MTHYDCSYCDEPLGVSPEHCPKCQRTSDRNADQHTSQQAWAAGDRVLWPNGVEGFVCGVDFSDGTLLDDCGGWHPIADCDRLPS